MLNCGNQTQAGLSFTAVCRFYTVIRAVGLCDEDDGVVFTWAHLALTNFAAYCKWRELYKTSFQILHITTVSFFWTNCHTCLFRNGEKSRVSLLAVVVVSFVANRAIRQIRLFMCVYGVQSLKQFTAVTGFSQGMGALDGCPIDVCLPEDKDIDYNNWKEWYSVVFFTFVNQN